MGEWAVLHPHPATQTLRDVGPLRVQEEKQVPSVPITSDPLKQIGLLCEFFPGKLTNEREK